MLLNEYQDQANGFINRPQYKDKMDYFLNTALGLTGEAGEFADIVKKIRFHGHPLTEEMKIKLQKELGDILWYIAQGCLALDISLSNVAVMNLIKLTDRHGGAKFSEAASLHKDESKEAVNRLRCMRCEQENRGILPTVPEHIPQCPKRGRND